MGIYKQPSWKNPVNVAAQATQDAIDRQKTVLRQSAQVIKNALPTKFSPGTSSRKLPPGIKR